MITDRDRRPYALEGPRPGHRTRRRARLAAWLLTLGTLGAGLAGFVWGVLP